MLVCYVIQTLKPTTLPQQSACGTDETTKQVPFETTSSICPKTSHLSLKKKTCMVINYIYPISRAGGDIYSGHARLCLSMWGATCPH